MDYASKLESLTTDIETAFDVAVSEAAKPFNAKFNALINEYVDSLNGRYKRHCFIFTDSMGDKTMECYHRVTGERLCWWSCEGHIFYEVSETIVLRSPFRDFHQYDLDTEIKEFMHFMAEYQSSMAGKYYFNWDGKTQFNDDDRMDTGNVLPMLTVTAYETEESFNNLNSEVFHDENEDVCMDYYNELMEKGFFLVTITNEDGKLIHS